MACYRPLTGYRSKFVNRNGKREIVFNTSDGYADMEVKIACGQCIGCRLERSRQWALRGVHEASLYDRNSFITLTYDDANLPADGSLDVTHFQKFMKRLRRKYPETKIRFFHCGEYGDRTRRPHYHAVLFNMDFNDKILIKEKEGICLYTSPTLSQLWPMGFNTVGDVTFESIAYVARYITKKVTGELAESHYQVIDSDSGELISVLKPEYVTMSRRPGIGRDWYDKFKGDCYPKDFVTVRGKKMRPPKFYDKILEDQHGELFERIKEKRIKDAQKYKADQTVERLEVKEAVKQAQLNQLKRKLE